MLFFAQRVSSAFVQPFLFHPSLAAPIRSNTWAHARGFKWQKAQQPKQESTQLFTSRSSSELQRNYPSTSNSDFPVPFIYLFVLKVLKWLFTPKSNIIIFPLACFVIYPSRMFQSHLPSIGDIEQYRCLPCLEYNERKWLCGVQTV